MSVCRMAVAALLVASSHSAAQGTVLQTSASAKIVEPIAVAIVANPGLEVLLSGGAPPVFTGAAAGRFGLVTAVSQDEAASLGVTIDRTSSESNGSRVFLIVAEFN